MTLVQGPNRSEPLVDEPSLVGFQSRPDPATAIVADHHDVLYAQLADRVLDDRQTISVGVVDEIGDIAMHEDLAGHQVDDLVGGNAAVGASDPEELGRLLCGEPAEETGVLVFHAARPAPIVPEQFAQQPHASNMPQMRGDRREAAVGRDRPRREAPATS